MPGSVKALRLHNLLAGNALTGAQLETELSNGLNKGAYERSLQQRTVVNALKKSIPALTSNSLSVSAIEAICNQDGAVIDAILANTAIAGNLSSTLSVLQKIADYPSELTKLVNNATAMTALAASTSGVDEIIADSVLRSAVVGSNTAISALTANMSAWSALCNSSAFRTDFPPSVLESGFGMIQNNGTAAAKYLAGVIGLDAASITAASEILDNATHAASVCASATARSALWHSDTLLNAITATTRTAIRASASYAQLSDTRNLAVGNFETVVGGNGNRLIIGLRRSSSSTNVTLATRRENSVINVSNISVGTAWNSTLNCPIKDLQYDVAQGSAYDYYFETLLCS